MRLLTPDEIKFVKETHFTPTVYQCDQYYLTTYTDERCECLPGEVGEIYRAKREDYANKWYSIIKKDAKEWYNVDLDRFLAKNLNPNNDDTDGISQEYNATYILYCFFTKEELEKLSNADAIKFLKDYRYYGGFRKWEVSNFCSCRLTYIDEAIEVYEGKREFYLTDNGQVWTRESANYLEDYYLEGHNWFDITYCCAKCKTDCGRKNLREGICSVSDFSRKCKSYKKDVDKK